MTEMKYEPVQIMDKDKIHRDVNSNDPEVVADALYSACRYDDDTQWIEKQCLCKLTSSKVTVRWAAATCLGDLALFRRPLNTTVVIAALEAAMQDVAISDPAGFSLSMVKEFLVMK